jgi:hypothetical protein
MEAMVGMEVSEGNRELTGIARIVGESHQKCKHRKGTVRANQFFKLGKIAFSPEPTATDFATIFLRRRWLRAKRTEN